MLISMANEQPPSVIFGRHSLALSGPSLKIGDTAPDFEATNSDLEPVHLSSLRVPSASLPPVFILSSVPSLDTGVCSAQTHRFEEEVGKLDGQAKLITISMDLPFAQGRFCGGQPKANTFFLSDHRLADFGLNYCTLIPDVRLLCRAVFVVGRNGRLVHVQYVRDTGTHPDYDAVLAAVRKEIERQ